jgi:serine/threonine protein phosphatase 1
MRCLTIGDIHGCSDALDALLGAIAPRPDDLIVTLGDYVNRGPDSAGVVERLVRLNRAGRLIALRGNHEQMMVEARDEGGDKLERFLNVGGDRTLASYSVLGDAGRLADVPDEHWDFVENACRDWYETATHFFVHANAYPDCPLAEQPDYMLRWESFDDPPPHESGKVMVCGHTPQKNGRPRNIGHAICIDTHAHGGGWLTCLDTSTGQFWQANEHGQTRQGWIDDHLIGDEMRDDER